MILSPDLLYKTYQLLMTFFGSRTNLTNRGWDNEKFFQAIYIRPKNNYSREINKLYGKKKIQAGVTSI